MKRDTRLILGLLKTIEQRHTTPSEPLAIPNSESVEYHLHLCEDAGYLYLNHNEEFELDKRVVDGVEYILVERLAWEGHERLNAARSQQGYEVLSLLF